MPPPASSRAGACVVGRAQTAVSRGKVSRDGEELVPPVQDRVDEDALQQLVEEPSHGRAGGQSERPHEVVAVDGKIAALECGPLRELGPAALAQLVEAIDGGRQAAPGVVCSTQVQQLLEVGDADATDEAPNRRVGPVRGVGEHVVPDQVGDAPGQSSRGAQRVQPGRGELGPHDIVTDEVVVGEGRRLPNVVEQGREARQGEPVVEPRRRRVDGAAGVVPEVLARNLPLRDPPLAGELRRDDGEQPCLPAQAQRDRGPIRAQEADQLREGPLGGDASGQAGLDRERGPRRRLDGEAERRDEADGPQHSQGVLTEAGARIPDGADDPRLEVGPAVERVDDVTGRTGLVERDRHRVDGEVAAGEVVVERVAEGDVVGPPVIRVRPVAAEGGHLVGPVGQGHDDRPEAVLVAGVGQEGEEAIGAGVGGHVPVAGDDAPREVPHAAADEMDLVAGGHEGARDRPDAPGDHGRDGPWVDRSEPAGRQFRPRKR